MRDGDLMYRCSQRGPITQAAMTLSALLIFSVGVYTEFSLAAAVVFAALMIFFGAYFSVMTIVVTEQSVSHWFGFGGKRWHRPLSDIHEAQVVQNKWYYGWGIRLTPTGWLYNVSGLGAVELTMQGDRRIRLGCEDPEALKKAIDAALGK